MSEVETYRSAERKPKPPKPSRPISYEELPAYCIIICVVIAAACGIYATLQDNKRQASISELQTDFEKRALPIAKFHTQCPSLLFRVLYKHEAYWNNARIGVEGCEKLVVYRYDEEKKDPAF